MKDGARQGYALLPVQVVTLKLGSVWTSESIALNVDP
jgi:hypothetical protein